VEFCFLGTSCIKNIIYEERAKGGGGPQEERAKCRSHEQPTRKFHGVATKKHTVVWVYSGGKKCPKNVQSEKIRRG